MVMKSRQQNGNSTVVQDNPDVRWQIDEVRRGLNHFCTTEQSQCCKARYLFRVFVSRVVVKVKAMELGKTLYELQTDLFRDYLQAGLRNPRISNLPKRTFLWNHVPLSKKHDAIEKLVYIGFERPCHW